MTIDSRVSALIDRYIAHRKALAALEETAVNPYLFPGRHYASHLTQAAVTYYLGKHGVKAEQLFATAIYNAYRSGLQHPKVLAKAYGVTAATAVKYLNLIDPRLVNEVERKALHAA
jgi:hypothetical protein